MSKFKFTFPNIFLWLGIISSCLLIENRAFLTATPSDSLPDLYFYMLFALAMSSYLALFLFEHLFNKTGVDLILIGALSILLAGGLIAIWTFRDMNFFPDDPSRIISLNFYDKLRLSIGYGTFILTMYSVLFLFSKNHFSLRSLSFLFIIIVGIVYFTIIYSVIAEFNSYVELFVAQYRGTPITSLFWNTNVFSGCIVMGIVSCIVLNTVKKNAFCYISISLFTFELFLTGSLLSLLTTIIGLTIYFLVEIFLSMKKHLLRSLSFLGLILLGGVLLVTLFACALGGLLGPFSKVLSVIFTDLRTFDYSTLNLRVRTWRCILEILSGDPTKLAFGVGYNVCNTVINSKIASLEPSGTTTIVSAHSGVMQILLCNGILGLVIYGLFLIYFIYCGIRMIKYDKRYAILSLVVGFIMLIYSFGESVIFFNCNVQGILVGIVFYLPLMMKYKHRTHTAVTKSLFAIPYDNIAIGNRRVTKITSFLILSLLCGLSPVLFIKSVWEQPLLSACLVLAELSLGALWLLFPYLTCQWHKNTTLKHFKIRLVLNCLFIAGMTIFGCWLYYLFAPENALANMYVFPLILFGVLLIDALYYSIIKKPSFKDYFATFTSFIQMSLVGAAFSVGGTILLLYFYQHTFDKGPFILIIVGVFSLLVYYATSFFYLTKEMRFNMSYMNNIYLTTIKRQYLIENYGRARRVKR